VKFSSEYLQHVVERLEGIGSHPLGFRVAGTPEEREAVDFVAREMRSLGLQDVTKEPVPVDAWRLREAFVELPDGARVEAASFGGVPETGGRGVSGELVRVGRGGRRRLDRLDVAGKIALVEWQVARLWPYHVGLELGLRGAKAMVLFAPEGGPFYQAKNALGTFDGIWHAEGPPCVTIRREDALKLDGRVRVVLRAPREPAKAANVTGYLDGQRRGAPTIVAGHHDGWFGAAFDDATGVAVTLELARAFVEARVKPRRAIAFVSHTAEEYGIAESAYDWCYGAWYQVVAEHRDWTTGSPFYLNVEGSGRRGDVFSIDVPPELRAWIRRHCRGAARDGLLPNGYALDRPNTWTEVWPFLAAGIPGINVSTFTTDFDRTEYHTQYDTSDKVDFDYLAKLTELCARLLLDEPALDFAARDRELRKHGLKLPKVEPSDERRRFTAIGRGLYGIDAIDAPRYPHEQTASDVELLERALADLDNAAAPLSRVGLNWLCADLSHEAFRIERGRRGRRARRACWGVQGDADPGPDLWRELASLRGDPGARPPGPWLEQSLRRHLDRSRRELARRRERMAAAAAGRVFPLARPREADLPVGPRA
jgi:Iap family predicted aminopeptidase